MLSQFFRKKWIVAAILSLVFSVLTGCGTVYRTPQLGQPSSTVRTVYEREGLFTWTSVKIESIDNQSAGLQMLSNAKMRVHPGPHMLTIIAEFNLGAFSGPFSAIVDVKADFKPYQDYRIKTSIQGSRFLAWVVDDKGKQVSAVSSVGYELAPTHSTIFIPVKR